MATPTPKRPPQLQPKPKQVVEVVDPRWLLKALAVTLAAATLLAYLAVCLLIYQGGWQLMLHPAANIDATPNVPFDPVNFDAAATGKPRLTGWWIPADSSTQRTILFLHDGDGSLSSNVRKLELLHRAGVNLFAFDYRGFGGSDPPHPTEARMAEDAAAALDYLVNTRHIGLSEIVPCGEGLGAALAAKLAADHQTIPAIVLDNPDPEAYSRATTGGKSRLLPMRLLVRERFNVAAAVVASRTPKLLLANDPFVVDAARTRGNQAFFRTVSDPKMSVTTSGPTAPDDYVQSVVRFLDEYAPR